MCPVNARVVTCDEQQQQQHKLEGNSLFVYILDAKIAASKNCHIKLLLFLPRSAALLVSRNEFELDLHFKSRGGGGQRAQLE